MFFFSEQPGVRKIVIVQEVHSNMLPMVQICKEQSEEKGVARDFRTILVTHFKVSIKKKSENMKSRSMLGLINDR